MSGTLIGRERSAVVAVAYEMARVMYFMLKRGESIGMKTEQ